MKKLTLLTLGLICAVYAIALSSGAVFNWSETTFDFGKIQVGKPVTHQFSFTNRGGEPLIISDVKASCGCTVAEYSKEPIEPGSQGYVKATYNAANPGIFTKTVTITANTQEGTVLLTLKGEVTN